MSLRKAHVMELPGSDTKAIWIDKGLAAHDEQLYWCMQLHLTADETCSYEVRTRLDKSPSSKVVMVTTHPAHGLPTKLEQVMLRGLAQQYMLDRRLPGYHRNSEVLDIIRKLEDPPTESILIGSTWVGAHKIDATNFILALTWDGEGLTVMQRAFIEQGATTQLPPPNDRLVNGEPLSSAYRWAVSYGPKPGFWYCTKAMLYRLVELLLTAP